MPSAVLVVMYVTLICPYCDRAKALLAQKGVTPVIIDVSTNDQARADMVTRSQGRKSVPQIFINDFHVGGCDDLYALNKTGQLDFLLQTASPLQKDDPIK